MRIFYDTKSTDEAASSVSGPDIHLLALLFAIGIFVRENSGGRFSVRPCVVAPPFDTDRAPPGDLTMFSSADSDDTSSLSSSSSALLMAPQGQRR